MILVFGTVSAVGSEAPKLKRLSVVSQPAGVTRHASAAKQLLPEKVAGYEIVPLDLTAGVEINLTPNRALGTAEDTDTQEAADGGTPSEKSTAEAARDAALAFDLVTAAELWRRAADTAFKTTDVVLRPRQTAALLLEAGAAAAAADETDLAILSFRRSIAVDGDILPGPEISPAAQTLFRQAVAAGPLLPEAPGETVLEEICEVAHTDGIVWVGVGVENGEWIVLFKRFMRGESVGEVETRRYAAPPAPEELDAERLRFEKIAAGRLAVVEPPKSVTPKDPKTLNAKKHWYQKWWFYTAVGAVLIAGGAVGVGVWAASQPETVDATLHY